jgi:hypothetical protein
MLGCHNMKMTLPAFTLTLKSHGTGNHTRVDNVFCSENLVNSIIKCNMDNAARPEKMDHYPIITQIDIQPIRTAMKVRPNYRLADWAELNTMLKANLAALPAPTEIMSEQEFDNKLKTLNDAIQDMVKKHVRTSKPSPYSKRW